jgi:hypothetical protein
VLADKYGKIKEKGGFEKKLKKIKKNEKSRSKPLD